MTPRVLKAFLRWPHSGKHNASVWRLSVRPSVCPVFFDFTRTIWKDGNACFPFRLFTLAASSGKRNASVWRPSVCLSVPFSTVIGHAAYFYNLNRARGACTWLTRGQHATRPAYISVRILQGRTYLLAGRCKKCLLISCATLGCTRL